MSGGGIVQHARELRLADDGLAVHAEDDVVDPQASFACWRVMIDGGDFDAAGLFEFQLGCAFGVDIMQAHAKIALGSAGDGGVFAGEGDALFTGTGTREGATEQAGQLHKGELWRE